MNLAPIIPIRRDELPPEKDGWAVEPKLDGFRGIGDTIRGKMLSKNLNPLKRFQPLLDALPLDCVFDGEICVLDQDGRPDFNALLFGRGGRGYPVPAPERTAGDIRSSGRERYGLQKSELFLGCTKKLYETVCSMDLEGLVLKKLDDPYDSERTKWWKVLNPEYSQKIDRGELFERRAG
jgi:bifunctional non-homologous end joining protein LigD